MGKPNKKGKKSSKPTAKNTQAPKKVEAKKKKKREKVTPARTPVPCIDGIMNPLLINKRNKRALCIAFANQLGGANGNEKQDALLVKCVREAGVLWKSGMTLDSFQSKDAKHISEAEQSGVGYAMQCGRKRHDDYMENNADKVAACLPFAKAFIKLMKKQDADYETAREEEMKRVPDLKKELAKQQAEAEAAKKAKKAKAKAKKTSKKPAGKGKSLKNVKGKPKASAGKGSKEAATA